MIEVYFWNANNNVYKRGTIENINLLIIKWKYKKTGLCYQVMDQPEREGNY